MNKVSKGTSSQSRENRDLLVLLEAAQSKSDYLSRELIAELAESLGLSISEVYGVATFYSFLSIKPQGRNVIRICKSLPCLELLYKLEKDFSNCRWILLTRAIIF